MTLGEERKLKTIADVLISTLGSMPADKADGIVAGAADTIYRDLLGKKGEIRKVQDVLACSPGISQYNVEYRWVDDKKI